MVVTGADEAAVAAALTRLGPLGARSVPIGAVTTYRVGGAAAVGATVRSAADLAVVAAAVADSGLPVLVVGRGSNLLVADAGFAGIAVLLDPDAFAGLVVDGPDLRAGAALPLPALARRSVGAGLTGMEWAVGVPGSVGGGVRMNAGGHGSEMAEHLVDCRVVDLAGGHGEVVEVARADLGLGYRRSSIGPSQVVVEARFELRPGDREAGLATIREIVRWRREHQPGGQNAGSVFTNPAGGPGADGGGPGPDPVPGDGDRRSAGWLVDAAGLKGLRIGTAVVSPKHANFIQADPGGSADDVWRVMVAVAERVEAQWGIRLHTEIRLVGFPQPSTSAGGLT